MCLFDQEFKNKRKNNQKEFKRMQQEKVANEIFVVTKDLVLFAYPTKNFSCLYNLNVL